jgi:hypothetical protein
MNENEIKKMQGDVVLSHIAVDLIDPSKETACQRKDVYSSYSRSRAAARSLP